MSVPKQAYLWAWPLILGFVAWARFGAVWGLLEAIGVYGWWLPMSLGRTAIEMWLRQHLTTAFLICVCVFATVVFAFVALFFGTAISVWWCWAPALCVGVILTSLVWPAQRRFWATLDG